MSNNTKNKNCPHDKQKYFCKMCGGGAFCIHNIKKSYCKDCGGSSLCIHNKVKYYCKDCGGTVFCVHNKKKCECKLCKGSSICIHNKIKNRCRDCKGSSFCIHDKEKYMCIECNGTGICEHKKNKHHCKECKGSALCEHGKQKSICKLCGGISICEHGKIKRFCKECHGTSFCIHDKRKSRCSICDGSDFCEHEKYKNRCKPCGGSALCKSEWCETTGNPKYDKYCLFCYINLFPDQIITRNYKTKEKDIVDRIKETFPDFSWVHDKKVQDGCSRRRPDLLLDMGSHIIIIEIDENKHTEYDCSCENKRLMELSQDLQHRPIVFIRFNPDNYINKDNELVKSCWKLNKDGIMQIRKSKILEWEERIECLKKQIVYWIKHPTEKTIEIIELFY
jgi:hypothetical protein